MCGAYTCPDALNFQRRLRLYILGTCDLAVTDIT